jgi:peptidyl-prolyl cis-trans isomerase D
MAEKSRNISKTLVWILMGLLILGLGGFGATNFSGSVTNVGAVGDRKIDVNTYARALQNEIRAMESQTGQAISFQQAQAFGLPDRVLAQLVVSAALEHEAAEIGLSVGDERLAEDLRNIRAFQGPDGQFDRIAYNAALDNAGLNERDFEEQLRAEGATTLLQGAVLAGTRLPDIYLETLASYAGERRAFSWTELGPEMLNTGLPVPSDDQLQAWYDENIARFTLPEARNITYVWLTPEMILDTVEVDEAALRAAYDEQSAAYNMPERRLVERLVFADQDAAARAAGQLATGEATFETLVEARGLDLADTDMGDVTRDDLGGAADLVFAAETGSIAGPAPTDLGPALFRVNAVLPAQSTSFEEAQPELRETLALDRARRVIETMAQDFDDELAAGATLEELAEQTDLQLGQIDWTAIASEGIAGYDAFRETAAQVAEGDYPEIDQLGDGGVFALRLNGITPPRPQPFDQVRDAVMAGWERAEQTRILLEEAETLASQLSTGADFESLNLIANSEAGLSRTAAPSGLPLGLLEQVFALKSGAAAALPGEGSVFLIKLDEILPADLEGEDMQALIQIFGDQAANDVANDLFRALSTDIQTRAGISIDQQALNAVHVNFQ